ncbi:hypothetical protein INT47_009068 [Mucor saturninus]|uniref:F-box domain-containing protein n=1 Tax=Mucor saturninus TaxID=64648 RepID=A0A8H7VAL1_9FUNG|nr:hypothetical protein INT47_009068 [Mucor saturninus]
MYKLSSLPIEILYLIGDFLEIKDLVALGRLNTWYSYWISIILGERISTSVQREGWRIHIDILAKSYPSEQTPSFPFSTELLLLSEYSRINPITLTLEFKLCPIDEDGLDAVKSATQSERSIVIFNKIKTNIDIVAYFAQISTNRRLQHVNQAGAAIMNDRNLWNQLQDNNDIHGNMAIMGSAFKLGYEMTTQNSHKEDMVKLIETFQKDFDKHKNALDASSIKKEDSAVISFDKIQVSPEWWIKQMKVPTYGSDEKQYPEFTEHGYW